MNKKILLLCFDFPPNDGIGGRRWSKFASELIKSGYEIHVIKSTPSNRNSQSQWTIAKNSKLFLYSVNRFLPDYFYQSPKNKFEILSYHLGLIFLKLFVRGSIYDKSIGLKNKINKLSQRIIDRENIINVIATGAPFNILYYCSLLKKVNPKINFIADYRDPWITARNYGMSNLKKYRLDFELLKQESVFKYADFITSPNQFLSTEIFNSRTSKINHNKFKTLTHFYDIKDLKISSQEINKSKKIILTYAGTLYLDVDPYLQNLSNILSNFKISYPKLYDKIEINFYTNEKSKFEILENHNSIINFHNPIGSKIFTVLNQTSYILIFYSNHNKNFKTTKFIEYLPLRKKYVYLGPDGYVSNYIAKHNLGFKLNTNKLYDMFLKREDDIDVKDYNFDNYSLNHVTVNLIKLLK